MYLGVKGTGFCVRKFYDDPGNGKEWTSGGAYSPEELEDWDPERHTELLFCSGAALHLPVKWRSERFTFWDRDLRRRGEGPVEGIEWDPAVTDAQYFRRGTPVFRDSDGKLWAYCSLAYMSPWNTGD